MKLNYQVQSIKRADKSPGPCGLTTTDLWQALSPVPSSGSRGPGHRLDCPRIPAIRLADAHDSAASGTYMYEFAWPSPVFGSRLGAFHGLEIPFVFGNLRKDAAIFGPLLGDDPPQELAATIHAAA